MFHGYTKQGGSTNLPTPSLITLLTDFGTIDGYVGAMKGVILARAHTAQVIDITHDIPPHNVAMGARALREAAAYFSAGTIHIAIVDPGVGTTRRPLLLEQAGQFFLGPDNGLLTLAVTNVVMAWELNRPQFFSKQVSSTFEGRDIFSSVAGHLAAGVDPDSMGTRIFSWCNLEEPTPVKEDQNWIGKVVHADRFGNLITNLPGSLAAERFVWEVWLGNHNLGRLRKTYHDVAFGQWLAYVGSSGMIEIAICEGNARRSMGMQDIEVRLCQKS